MKRRQMKLRCAFFVFFCLALGCSSGAVDPMGGSGGAAMNGAVPSQPTLAAQAQGCSDGLGNFLPIGSTRCMNGMESICQNTGIWQTTGMVGLCGGELPETCEEVETRKSYIGCDYWPVDLDNAQEVSPDAPDPLNLCRNAGDDYKKIDDLYVCVNGTEIPNVCRTARNSRTSCPDIAGLCSDGRTCPGNYVCLQSPTCTLDAQRSNFTIVVSNPSANYPATVTLEAPGGQSISQMVAPLGVARLEPYKQQWAESSIEGTSRGANAFHLTSNLPIIAYQFNPLDNEGVFSNDGSLLLPSHAVGSDYVVTTIATLARPPIHSYHGYVTIVATSPGVTSVEVIPTADVKAGIQEGAITAGTRQMFTLQQGEVLNLQAADDGDLTGTQVFSSAQTPFAVYVGHEAAIINSPGVSACCADHLEEQLFPTSIWGRKFVVVRSESRGLYRPGPEGTPGQTGAPVPDRVRITAGANPTTVSLTPPSVQNPCGQLQPYKFCDIDIDTHIAISANAPIQVAHFFLSAGGREGDPALAFIPPIDQYRDEYAFLVPEEYDKQFISVSSQFPTGIMLDGQDISAQMVDVDGTYSAGKIAVQPGAHTLTCPDRCGLMAYGYSRAVSYYFAAGLDLKPVLDPQ